jgi:hypothetical protein
MQPPDVTPGTVRQVMLPSAARALSMLSHIDYEDAFLVETCPAQHSSGEQWARVMLEDAPMSTRNALTKGWSALGLQLGSPELDRFVIGWEVRRSTPDVALLGADGLRGLSGELLFTCEQHTLLFATFVQLENRAARVLWAGIADRHRRVVRNLLTQATGQDRLPEMGTTGSAHLVARAGDPVRVTNGTRADVAAAYTRQASAYSLLHVHD